MKNLRPQTLGLLNQIEALSGRPVTFQPDASLQPRAILQLARDGAPSHVLRYRPANEPLDYWMTYQAGYPLRLFSLPAEDRFDFAGTGKAPDHVVQLLTLGQAPRPEDQAGVSQFAELVAHWALMNLRSYAIGMRIDQWLADEVASEFADLRSLQAAGVDWVQQENAQLLSRRFGTLSIPVPLLGPVAAYALFADRLLGKTTYAIPYRATGCLELGEELLDLIDRLPPGPAHDRALIDAWGQAIGMSDWYAWTPYQP